MEPYENDHNNKQKIIATAVTLMVVVLIVFGISAFSKDANDDSALAEATDTATTLSENTTTEEVTPTPAPTPSPTPATATPPAAVIATIYKDGTYSASGSYSSPGGVESVTVSITLSGDTITGSTVTGNANDDEAEAYQNDFISGYKALVTGKKIDSVKLNRVSGSSLTSEGFNSALTKIKNQARV